jgi:hypothetical protein
VPLARRRRPPHRHDVRGALVAAGAQAAAADPTRSGGLAGAFGCLVEMILTRIIVGLIGGILVAG